MTLAADQSGAPSRPRVKVGLVITTHHGPGWLADIVSAITDTGDAEVIKVLWTGLGTTSGATRMGRALLGAYGWIDGRVFGRPGDPMLTLDLGDRLAQIMTSDGQPNDPSETPDIVIRFDDQTAPIGQWPNPEFGTWTLVHGVGLPTADRLGHLGLAPSGPEMLLGRSLTISQLVATSSRERRVIGQVVSRVDRLSMRRGSRGHVCKLPRLVSGALSFVRATGTLPEPIVETYAPERPPSAGSTLGTAGIARGLARVAVGYSHRLIVRRTAPERWVVGISRQHRDPRKAGDRPFRFLEAPAGREWADPFPVRRRDVDLVFLEEYIRASHRGRLAVVQLDDSPRGWRSVDTILDLPTHLSYPFVFEWSGAWYLLPEQASTGGLQLYVAETFPTVWRLHSTALDQPVADATIAEIDGRWWMFAAITPDGGNTADELHLFHATTPLGPWTAHARNPVVSDVRSARPAGRLYRRNGVWYRVAQDGAVGYGHSIAIVRIDRIDDDGYRETVTDIIRPDWAPGLIGTHTINSDGGLTAVDVLRPERRVAFWRTPR